jgi:hypothetical protein
MAEERTGRSLTLAVAAISWAVWCLLSAAPVSFIVVLASELLKRPLLADDAIVGVAVETVVLTATAWVAFRLLRRLDPPPRYWLVAPGGYVAAFVAFLLISRVGGDTIVTPEAGTLLELVVVSIVAGAAAYMGTMGPQSAGRPVAADIADVSSGED